MKRVAVFAAAALLSGCTTFSTLDKGLQTFVGKPPEDAFGVLGFPQGEATIAGRKVYTWGRSFTMALPTTSTSTTNGNYSGRPFSASTTTTQWQDAEFSCDIRLIVGPDGLVASYEWGGNIGGCEGYAHRLKTRLKAK